MLEALAGAREDEWTQMATLAAELTLRVHAGEALEAALADELRAVRPEGRRCEVLWRLSHALVQGGRLAEAESLLSFGFARAELGALSCATPLWQLRAETARLRGRWEEAERHLDEMERGLSVQPPAESEARALHFAARSHLAKDRGQILLELGLLDRCRDFARAALEAAEISGQPSALAAAHRLAVDRELMAGDAEAALHLTEACLAQEALAPWRPLFHLAAGLAWVERVREEGASPELVRGARGALEAATVDSLAGSERLKLALAWSDLEFALGRFAEARVRLAQVRELVEPARGRRAPPREAVLVASLAWELAEAAQETEEARTAARTELFEAWDQLLEQWAATPIRPGGIGFLHLAWRAQVLSDVLGAELSAAAGPAGVERAFARLLQAEASGTAARERRQEPLTLEEVRARLLAPERGLLVLFPARDRAHLFVLDGSGLIGHHWIHARRDALREQAVRVAGALIRPDGKVEDHVLESLHQVLLPPEVRRRMEAWSEAFTVGFDLQRDLSFGLLGGAEGPPYSARLALAALPSLATGVALADASAAPRGGSKDLLLLVAGSPPPEFDLPVFEFGRRERARWLAPFAPERVDVLVGPAATRAALLDWPGLSETRILHLLAHGRALPGQESSAALVLGGAGPPATRFFTAEDARRLGFRGLVILSACGSGRGPPRTGDDRLVSLAGAFLEAGAPCVIVSRFPVDYHATLALMEVLHRFLAEGASPAEALRAAVAALLARNGADALAHATFEVLGLGFDPVLAR